MPEQVWDEPDLPDPALRLGKPAGSAVPLVWAHAEYLKLLRSAIDGKVFDRIDPVYERYCEPEGRSKLRRDLEIYSQRRPIQSMTRATRCGSWMRRHFELVWTADGWKTTQTTLSRGLGQRGIQRRHRARSRAATLWNGPSIGRNRTPGLDTMWKSRLMPD